VSIDPSSEHASTILGKRGRDEMKLLVQTTAQRSAGHLMLFQGLLERHVFSFALRRH
jgi:hypothetical protein